MVEPLVLRPDGRAGRPTRRVLVVFGTRPEAIKLAPVIRALKASGEVAPVVVSTGQHREMLDQMLSRMRLTVDHRLEVMRDRQRLSELTARLVDELGQVVRAERPDGVVVQGDTTSAMCGSLAAFYEQVPIAHVEAGLRSGVSDNPFPEELNRKLIGQMARWHFAPTPRAAQNLRAEGVPQSSIEVTGNTGIDNLLWMLEHEPGRSAFRHPGAAKILLTLHRRENQGAAMRQLGEAVARLADRGDVEVLLPLHKSPAVREALTPVLGGRDRVTITEPLDYLDFTASLAAADLVLTDSGGVQEEAPGLGKPVLVLRDNTERPEAIEAGVARLVGVDPDAVYAAASELLDDADQYGAMARAVNPFGDGQAASRIHDRLLSEVGGSTEPAQLDIA